MIWRTPRIQKKDEPGEAEGSSRIVALCNSPLMQYVSRRLRAGEPPRGRCLSVEGALAASATGKSKMKSKISIWDCRRAIDIAGGAIDIAGGLPLTIRGDLFAGPGPHPVGRWFPETAVIVTQLEVKQGRWVCGNISFTRHGQEHLTKLARDIIAGQRALICLATIGRERPLEAPGNDNRLRAGREPFGHTSRLSRSRRGEVTRRAVAQRRSRASSLTRPLAEAIRGFGWGFVVGLLARSAVVFCKSFFLVLYL